MIICVITLKTRPPILAAVWFLVVGVMAKIDWGWHRENYKKHKLESGVTYKEYAEFHSLNPNTARRELSKKTDDEGLAPTTPARDQKEDLIIRKKGRKLNHSNKLEKLIGQDDPGATRASTKNKKNNSKGTRAKMIKPVHEGEVIPHVPKQRGKGKQFETGNEVNVVANTRGKPREVDRDAAVSLLEAGLEECEASTVKTAVEHMQLLSRTTARAVELFETEIANTDIPRGKGDKDGDDDAPSGPHPLLKLTKLLIEVGYRMDDHATRISSIRSSREKLKLDREKLGAKANEARVIATAYQLRDENDWDIAETAEYIERHGVKLPDSIALRLAKEIKEAEPPVSDVGAVDDDQLEEEARKYREAQAGKEAFLKERRETVARIVDEGGYGDTNHDGIRREGELDPDEEGLDLDYEATRELYGEGDEIAIAPPDEDE